MPLFHFLQQHTSVIDLHSSSRDQSSALWAPHTQLFFWNRGCSGRSTPQRAYAAPPEQRIGHCRRAVTGESTDGCRRHDLTALWTMQPEKNLCAGHDGATWEPLTVPRSPSAQEDRYRDRERPNAHSPHPGLLQDGGAPDSPLRPRPAEEPPHPGATCKEETRWARVGESDTRGTPRLSPHAHPHTAPPSSPPRFTAATPCACVARRAGGRFCDSLRRLARRERPVRACGGGAAWGHGGGRAGVARLAQLVLQPLQRHQRRRAALRLRRQAPHQRAGCQHRYADVSRYGRDPLLPLCAVFIGAAELLWVWRNRVLTELLSVQGSSSGTRSASPPSPSARTGSTALCVPAARTTAACGCGTRRGWSCGESTACTRWEPGRGLLLWAMLLIAWVELELLGGLFPRPLSLRCTLPLQHRNGLLVAVSTSSLLHPARFAACRRLAQGTWAVTAAQDTGR